MDAPRSIEEILNDGTTVTLALLEAALFAMRQARFNGVLVPIWEDEQVKWVRPEDIEPELDAAQRHVFRQALDAGTPVPFWEGRQFACLRPEEIEAALDAAEDDQTNGQ